MKPLSDYSFIKGACADFEAPEAARKHLGYGKKIGLNSIRFWLIQEEYEKDPEVYCNKLSVFADVCEELGYTMVPILFNGNGLDPDKLKAEQRGRCEGFCDAILETLSAHPALLMWDIMNEPACNDYINDPKITAKEQEERLEVLTAFVRHFCSYVKAKDPENAITVGHYMTKYLPMSLDLVDVVSYHNYGETEGRIRQAAEEALEAAHSVGKPLINNEMSCIARANPYDISIQIMDEYHIPWYVFCLMIDGYWGSVHGIFYEDGTVRDPSIAAAVMGIFRKRDLSTMNREKPDREGHARACLERLKDELCDSNADVFAYKDKGQSDLLDTMEEMAHLLEAGQMAPMRVPPTVKVRVCRKSGTDPEVVRALALELAEQLKKGCQLL